MFLLTEARDGMCPGKWVSFTSFEASGKRVSLREHQTMRAGRISQ